jgi:hypothetical protein
MRYLTRLVAVVKGIRLSVLCLDGSDPFIVRGFGLWG